MELKIRRLIDELNAASDAYYNSGQEVMSNREFDLKLEELKLLEEQTGIVFPDSPTLAVGADVKGDRKTVQHEYEPKSLKKTKDRDEIKKWLSDHVGALSFKLDGQTVVLTYEDGKLVLAATRGNGSMGNDITDIAPFIDGIPSEIGFKGKLVLRGESIMSYSEFERINSEIMEEADKYKNPRNLAVGTTNILDIEEFKQRKLHFIAFKLVMAEGGKSRFYDTNLKWLSTLGFTTVPYGKVNKDNLDDMLDYYTQLATEYDFPIDGLVLAYNDEEYGDSLGSTGSHEKHAFAFKWADETVDTTLLRVDWSASKTGLLNPVAVFAPIEIEGTTVQQASVHNVSIFENLELGEGDIVQVYKANMIIPQIAENLTRSKTFTYPATCPVCGSETQIKLGNKGTKTLICPNPNCAAKALGQWTHFVSRDCMDVEGLAESQLTDLINMHYLRDYADLYHLHEKDLTSLTKKDGWGEKSLKNLLDAIENSRKTKLSHFIDSLSIPLIGTDAGKNIAGYCNWDPEKFMAMVKKGNFDELLEVNNIGTVMVNNLNAWVKGQLPLVSADLEKLEELVSLLDFEIPVIGKALEGISFVVTGSVHHFPKRIVACT